ncbi:hook-length control protein FliK [Pseudobutyrivibrio sp. ACV-2]|uniref:flagellar hook-length control protein FliK n=1 Tax=Pseudobutyrivibrio sp. ACV-2 TaxID=1520801 RepID=UPI00089B9B56|nr:flagellar hook-length control protein FliK [Pseudobutyrivibrio sp. ACV-2]SDZ83804.1 hook-length control protein FliK [Pseudobutyrivibrio sp. ACV-2]
MNINTGLNPYNSNFINNVADRGKLSQSQSLTGSPTDTLKEGDVFEGSVNSVENGKVTIGLANGQTMTARLDSGVSLVPGQSIFFEVKSNDGILVQIRPVNLNGLEANPTLLKALDMANISANERTINMVNSMMQNSMSINPENLASMHRVMLNNPEVDVQTIVTMAKHGLEITPDNVAAFQNYANDKAVIIDNFNTISDMLPKLMSSDELSASDVINLNSNLKAIFIDVNPENAVQRAIDGMASSEQLSDGNIVEKEIISAESKIQGNPEGAAKANNQDLQNTAAASQDISKEGLDILNPDPNKAVVSGKSEANALVDANSSNTLNGTDEIQDQTNQQIAKEAANTNDAGKQVLNAFASEKQITSFNTLLNNLPDFPKTNMEIFGENGALKADANIKEVFREITEYFENHSDIPKETLNDIIKTPLYKGLLKNLIADSFSMEPKDITKPGEISKLYERVLKQTEALERLISNFNDKAADAIKNQANEIKQNINFMNSANDIYNFVQIPLKMYNQNTDSMLYVRQNKKGSYEAGEEITAFLHFDMEYLGPTDVFITLKEMKVGCKWNLANESSLKIIEDNIDILTERLNEKGFTVNSQMTCGEPKTDFVEDFLGAAPMEPAKTTDGLVHRYSFDMRA